MLPECRLTHVDIEWIDTLDRYYSVRPPWAHPTPQLIALIKNSGIRSPLVLQEKEPGRFRIVCGFLRLAAARELGHQKLPAILAAETPRQLFVAALCENLGSQTLGLLERAEAVRKLEQFFQIQTSEIIEEFLPLLGLPAHRNQYDRLTTIAALSPPLQKALSEGLLTFESAATVAEWNTAEQELVLHLTERLKLGINKQRQILELLGDLRILLQTGVVEIWNRSGADRFDRLPELSPAGRFREQRDCLYRLRYPTVAEFESRYERLRSNLGFPQEVQLRVPPFFEGSEIEVSIRARTARQLQTLAEQVGDAAGRDPMAEIFAML